MYVKKEQTSFREVHRALDRKQSGSCDSRGANVTSREAQISQLLSEASTPRPRTRLAWKHTSESFVLASGEGSTTLSMHTQIPVLEGRLAFMLSPHKSLQCTPTTYYFTADDSMRYIPFCADFG